MQGIKILGTGSYIPPKVVTNNDFAEYIETSDEWIRSRTGIGQRHISDDKSNVQMAVEAANKAIADSGVSPEEIDLVIVSTCTPDYFYPSMSCMVQAETGAVNAAAIDVNAACTGFIVALDMAHKYFSFEEYKNILIVASERLSTHLDFEDRASCVLFGDGAGAVVVTKSDKKFCSFIGASGETEGPNKTLYCKVNYDPNCPFIDDKKLYDRIITSDKQHKYLQMAGKGVYKFAVTAMPKAAKIVCDKVGIDVKDVDLVIPHQANIRIIETAVKTMGIDPEKVYTHLEHYGNTSSSCIPMCLDDLKRAGKLFDGMKICLVGFGAGLTYGAAYLEY
ncbi:MAG: beta-ketoacyl-ACP synthase III [Ruminiclostridium sp.]